MPAVWIENLHNLHCPTCDARLVARAGKFEPMGRPDPVYQEEGSSLTCPAGHQLPDGAELYAYANRAGHEVPAMGSPVREVPAPR